MESDKFRLTKALMSGIAAFVIVSYLTGGFFPLLEVFVAAGIAYFVARR